MKFTTLSLIFFTLEAYYGLDVLNLVNAKRIPVSVLSAGNTSADNIQVTSVRQNHGYDGGNPTSPDPTDVGDENWDLPPIEYPGTDNGGDGGDHYNGGGGPLDPVIGIIVGDDHHGHGGYPHDEPTDVGDEHYDHGGDNGDGWYDHGYDGSGNGGHYDSGNGGHYDSGNGGHYDNGYGHSDYTGGLGDYGHKGY